MFLVSTFADFFGQTASLLLTDSEGRSDTERDDESSSILLKKDSEIQNHGTYNSIPFNRPILFPESLEAIQQSHKAGKLSGDGLNTRKCTTWFQNHMGVEKCLLTPSCTAALEMAALLLQIGPGDEVIVPSYTFVSVANAFALRGASVVFCDCEQETPNPSIQSIRERITENTKAIVIVHYAGIPVDVQNLLPLGIPIVEDCAHAIGSVDPQTGKPIGSLGCLATFSFHDSKNVPIGEGGMLVVNDEKLWQSARIIREKGTNRTQFLENRCHFYTWLSLGSSYLLSEVDAGMLYGCLLHFRQIQSKRLAVWDKYHGKLLESSLYQKPAPNTCRANAHMYYLTFETIQSRKQFSEWMKKAGVSAATHYMPLNKSPFVIETFGEGHACPQAEQWSNTIVRLPLFYDLSGLEQDFVIDTVNRFVLVHEESN